jgi:hypothetical protein
LPMADPGVVVASPARQPAAAAAHGDARVSACARKGIVRISSRLPGSARASKPNRSRCVHLPGRVGKCAPVARRSPSARQGSVAPLRRM